MLKHLLIAAAAVTASPALAVVSYDIGAGSFTDPNFTFGSVGSDGSFTQFALTSCADINQGACYRGTDGQYQVIFPAGTSTMLLVHPGQSSSSALRFTAPTTSTYRLNGVANSADTGLKVVLYSDKGGSPSQVGTLSGSQSLALNQTFTLAAGQTFAIAIDPSNGYSNDSTTLSGSIAAVPEPATWGMMLLGFGLVGAAARGRRRNTVAA